jgi:hypothetical protein
VITTDNIAAPVVDAIETSRVSPGAQDGGHQGVKAKEPPVAPTASAPVAAPANPVRDVAAKTTPAVEASAPPAPASQSAPAKEGAVAAAAPPAASVVPAAAPVAEPKPQHASAKEERGKKARDKRKREAKSRRAAPPARDDDDDEAEDTGYRTTRAVERDDSGSHRRGRIVERWTEREYDVPSYNGSQRRRVIVIRRNGDRADAYMPSAGAYSRSVFGY